MRFNEHILYDAGGSPVVKSFHSSVLPGKREYNAHHHTECELSLFISGSGVYTVGEKRYTFKSGDVFLFGSDEVHCITEICGQLDLLNIHFEPRLLWENPDNAELLCLFTARKGNFSNRFSEDEDLKTFILRLEKENEDRKTGYRTKVVYNLFSALVHILRKYDCAESISAGKILIPDKLKDAMMYIDKNLEKNITLKEVAEIACMAPTYFSAVFKKYNGIPPWQYIKIKRVEKSIEMLRTSNLTKLEIAEKCGFGGSSNFYKTFAEITGKKPQDYAK